VAAKRPGARRAAGKEPDGGGGGQAASREPLASALYVVATPVGNLQDITLRALDVLRRCDVIASEDTRTTLKLLSRFDIHTPLVSYHQHSGGERARELVARIRSGGSVALVSEAGTPGISDPGHELVRGCLEEGLPVVPVPGACALVAFLSAAGLNTSSFVFAGFPPRKPGERLRFFQSLSSETRTVVFYESPGRIRATLEAVAEALPGRRVCLGRELTKLHEEFIRGSVEEVLEVFRERRPRGEFVVGLEGAPVAGGGSADLEQEYHLLVSQGMDDRAAVALLARKSGRPRREVYAAVLQWKGKRNDGS
jgi:16S rRNA (cytidine1402-2'-O)-methyltransferase